MQSTIRIKHLHFIKILLVLGMEISTSRSNLDERLRLPTDIIPIHYIVQITPLIEESNWKALGEIWIHLNSTTETNKIVFNINQIEIDESSVSLKPLNSSDRLAIEKQEFNNDTQMYSLELGNPLTKGGSYRLHIKYTAELNDLLQGFYRSSYIDSATQEKRWLASTQFSPIDARRAFPCWDEPAFKAKFTISLGRHKNMTSLSNMPCKHTSIMNSKPGWMWDHYMTSLPMSTYIVGFIVSDLASSKVESQKSNYEIKVWARNDALSQTSYSAKIAPELLNYLEKYFKIQYPLPKLDLVAVPDFGFRGMENWGLIIFRESAMLYDPELSSADGKKNVGFVIGHEIAHQWFGNLVTPQWWEDLWLKEGFATYIGCRALAQVEPEWDMMGQFVLDTMHNVLSEDSLKNSHKISQPVEDPKEIRQKFDVISYDKGASIIRMMSHFLEEENFKGGLTNYLTKYKFKNANEDNLWDCFKDYSNGINVKHVMDSWTSQTGYPLLTAERNYSSNTVVIKQTRFLLSGEHVENNTLWYIPVSYAKENSNNTWQTAPKFWLHDKEKTIEIPDLSKHEWLLLNIKQTGFYRVNYDKENWNLLNSAFQKLPPILQAQLLDDGYNLASAGYIPYSIPLLMSEQLKSSTEYFPWRVTLKEYTNLKRMMPDSSREDKLKNYILKIISKQNLSFDINHLPVEHLKRLQNIKIMEAASNCDNKQIIKEADEIIIKMMKGENIKLIPEYKNIVYCKAIQFGSDNEWDFVWNKYQSSNLGSEKENLLSSLSCTKNEAKLKQLLNSILDPKSGIRKQDGSLLFTYVAAKKMGAPLALNFLRNNWKEILNYFGMSFNVVSKMVAALGIALHTENHLQEVKQLYEDNKSNLGTTEISMLKTIEKIELNIEWLKNNLPQIDQWLQSI